MTAPISDRWPPITIATTATADTSKDMPSGEKYFGCWHAREPA